MHDRRDTGRVRVHIARRLRGRLQPGPLGLSVPVGRGGPERGTGLLEVLLLGGHHRTLRGDLVARDRHRVEPGSADRSYGIEVARLAGLPLRVIERAREILRRHEQSEHQLTDKLSDLQKKLKELQTKQAATGGAATATPAAAKSGDDTILTAEQAKYIGVPKDGPYKPDYSRY